MYKIHQSKCNKIVKLLYKINNYFYFYYNRDALNLLKMSPAAKAIPVMAAPSPVLTPAASHPPLSSRPNLPPLSVPGKPGASVSTVSLPVCVFLMTNTKLS